MQIRLTFYSSIIQAWLQAFSNSGFSTPLNRKGLGAECFLVDIDGESDIDSVSSTNSGYNSDTGNEPWQSGLSDPSTSVSLAASFASLANQRNGLVRRSVYAFDNGGDVVIGGGTYESGGDSTHKVRTGYRSITADGEKRKKSDDSFIHVVGWLKLRVRSLLGTTWKRKYCALSRANKNNALSLRCYARYENFQNGKAPDIVYPLIRDECVARWEEDEEVDDPVNEICFSISDSSAGVDSKVVFSCDTEESLDAWLAGLQQFLVKKVVFCDKLQSKKCMIRRILSAGAF